MARHFGLSEDDDRDHDANVELARFVWTVLGIVATFMVAVGIILLAWLGSMTIGLARDLDGRYAAAPLKAWFDQLASGRGPCCSFADGVAIKDVDWDTQDGRYRVHLHGAWLPVPDAALVKDPNRFGPAVVWPYQDSDGSTQIRCFLPGAGA